MAAKNVYTVIAFNVNSDVITDRKVTTVAQVNSVSRDWLRYSNVGMVRILKNGSELFRVYVKSGNGACVIDANGNVKNIRL